MSINPILQTRMDTLNREDVMGNMQYATILGYYAQLLGQTKMLQQTSKVHENYQYV